ncbi:hypothetical protein BH10PSE15_BH10PSE15_05870 [soil metagenome]
MTTPAEALASWSPQRYATVRAAVRTGDLAICSGDQMFSRVIQWATRSDWSHIAMIVRLEELDRVMVMEAVQKIGVRVVPLSRWITDFQPHDKPFNGKVVIARHDAVAQATPDLFRHMSSFATDQLGCPFDAAKLVKIALRIGLARLGVRLPRLIQPNDEYFCSEYLDECYRKLGVKIPWDGRGFIAPSDFARAPHVHAVMRVSRFPFREGAIQDDE